MWFLSEKSIDGAGGKICWATKNIDFIRQQNLSGLVKKFSWHPMAP
jgi:hypothetical protein